MLQAIDQDCQCYITRDFKYRDVLFAKDLNLSLIDVSYYAEFIVLKELCNKISLHFPMLTIDYYKFTNPYSYF